MSLPTAIVLATAMICVTVLVITGIGLKLAKQSRVCPRCGESTE